MNHDDINPQIKAQKETILRRLKERQMDLPELPPAEPFTEYATMFKLFPQCNRGGEPHVACINCAAAFPLKDILDGELEEDQCPACKVWALQYYRDKKYQEVPHAE